MEPLDLLGLERDGYEPPAKGDLRVVGFRFGKLADPLHELQRGPEIGEPECPSDAAILVDQLPIGCLPLVGGGFR